MTAMKSFLSVVFFCLFLLIAFWIGRLTSPSDTPTGNGISYFAKPAVSCEQSVSNTQLGHSPAPTKEASKKTIQEKLDMNNQRPPSAARLEDQYALILELAKVDPQAAMAKAQQLSGDLRARAVSGVLDIWGNQNPEEAWGWVESSDPNAIHQFDQLLEVFGRNNPAMAAEYAANIAANRPELTQEVFLSALMGIAHSGSYDFARNLVETANISTEDRAVLMNFVSGSWATYEPEAAAQWVMSQPADLRASALIGLGESWSNVDPQRAANFASTIEDGEQRKLMLQQSISKWLVQDEQAATNWLASAEDHTDYDDAIHGLATMPHIVRDNTDMALSWTERIHDQNQRMSALQVILYELNQKDPAAAAAYIRNAPRLSVIQRTILQNSLKQ